MSGQCGDLGREGADARFCPACLPARWAPGCRPTLTRQRAVGTLLGLLQWAPAGRSGREPGGGACRGAGDLTCATFCTGPCVHLSRAPGEDAQLTRSLRGHRESRSGIREPPGQEEPREDTPGGSPVRPCLCSSHGTPGGADAKGRWHPTAGPGAALPSGPVTAWTCLFGTSSESGGCGPALSWSMSLPSPELTVWLGRPGHTGWRKTSIVYPPPVLCVCQSVT